MVKTSILLLICIPIIYVLGVFIYASATKFKPIETTHLDRSNPRPPFMVQDTSFSILVWNIGYGGLGKESDFFYDGGEQVRMSEEIVEKNVSGLLSILKEEKTDFICLQEVDTCSKRSHYTNQFQRILDEMPSYEGVFGKNYDVNYVPLPFFKPLGKITSGLATYSQLPSTYPMRESYASEQSFPNGLFMLSRCFTKVHIPLSVGKDLVIVNTHNSAYDSTGALKKAELDKLMPYVYDLYDQGHYVVVAGDWNQCPPDYETKGKEEHYREFKFSPDFLNPGWKWAADVSTPTNRKLDQVYDSETSYTSVIDYFLLSPNLKMKSVRTIDTKFEFSDHQPVRLDFELNSGK